MYVNVHIVLIGEKQTYKNLRDVWRSYPQKIEMEVRKCYYLTKQWTLDITGSGFYVKCVDHSRCNNRMYSITNKCTKLIYYVNYLITQEYAPTCFDVFSMSSSGRSNCS